MFLSIGNLNAQDSIQYKKNEIWVTPFNSGITYKRGINSTTFLKTGVSLNFEIGNSKRDYYHSSYNLAEHHKYKTADQFLNIYLGIEKRSVLSSKMTFFHGPEISYGLSGNQSKNKDKNDISYQDNIQNSQTFGVGYSIGAIYSFNNMLGLGVSWSPRIYYNYTKSESSYQYASPQATQTNINKDNNLGIQLTTPSVNLILKF